MYQVSFDSEHWKYVKSCTKVFGEDDDDDDDDDGGDENMWPNSSILKNSDNSTNSTQKTVFP